MIATINSAIARKREEGEKGFTLIELLVVILIIGVLAAIAIPAFLNQRASAWEASVKSDLANAALAAEQYAVDEGAYTGLTDAGLTAGGFNPTTDVHLTVTVVDANNYTLQGVHKNITDKSWTFTSSTGKTVPTAAVEWDDTWE